MKFAIPRIWQEPTNHTNDCYFCTVDPSKRRTAKNASAIVYPSIPSSIAPVPHSDQLPVPIPTRCQDSVSADESTTNEDDITIDDYVLNSNSEKIKHYYPNQKDLNDLNRDLGLTKSNAELLTSRLKQWNLVENSVQITEQRKRHQSFSSFFTMQNAICFCNNVSGLFLEFLVSRVNGVFSLTVHQRVSRQFYFIKATNTHLFLLLIQSILKKLTKM